MIVAGSSEYKQACDEILIKRAMESTSRTPIQFEDGSSLEFLLKLAKKN